MSDIGPQEIDSEATPGLNQISVYLIREGVGDYALALRSPNALDSYELSDTAGIDGRLYVQPGALRTPTWLGFLQSLVGDDLPAYANEHVSAVLFVAHEGRTYALTFGFGRFLLDPDATEPEFGLRVAAGLVNPEQINAVDSRVLEATRIQVRRQASRGTTTQAIGLDMAREMLRALSGHVLDETLGTRVTGSESLGLSGRVDAGSLISRLDLFHSTYANQAYRRRFPHIDRWQPVTDRTQIDRLDEQLAEAVRRRDARLDLGVPEIVDWKAAGFRYSPEPAAVLHALPSLEDYLANREQPTVQNLRGDRLILVGSDSEAGERIWSIYKALEWEVQDGEKVFVLAEGKWWLVDSDYLAGIDARIGLINSDPIDVPFADPREWERDYSERVAAWRPGRFLLDRKLAKFEDESGTIEYCDVFTGDRQFMHLKPDKGSSALSHLFAQGLVAADLFRHSPPFRAALRDGFLASVPELAAKIPVDRPAPQDFEVVFLVVTDDRPWTAAALPVFSRIHLARMADSIERLDYRLRVFGSGKRVGARPPEAGPTEKERRDAVEAAQAAQAARAGT